MGHCTVCRKYEMSFGRKRLHTPLLEHLLDNNMVPTYHLLQQQPNPPEQHSHRQRSNSLPTSSAPSVLPKPPNPNQKETHHCLRNAHSWSIPTSDPAKSTQYDLNYHTGPLTSPSPPATAQISIFPPPPYAGAPPLSAGAGIPQVQWQAGFWQFNTAYKTRPGANIQQQSHVLWIPSQQWMAYRQQPQHSFNPYKRVPRPPSEDYLATKLSDNPLGLMNMALISIEEHYPQGQPEPELGTQAPWIWMPSTRDTGSPSTHSSGAKILRIPSPKLAFSPHIVRTPEHYRLSSAASSSSSSPFKAASHRSGRANAPATPPRDSRATSSSPHAHLTDITSQHPHPHNFPRPLSPNAPPQRVRRGYWNQRGDHLTLDGYIVYAPQELAYPTELAIYPPEEEGYRNHEGAWRRWAERPELPESLPKRGRPPEKPYANFVVYVNRDSMGLLAPHRPNSRRSSIDSFRSDLLPLEEEGYRNDEHTWRQLVERRGRLPDNPSNSFITNPNRDPMAPPGSKWRRSSIESLRSGLRPKRITKRHSYHNVPATAALLTKSNSTIPKYQGRRFVNEPPSTHGLMSNTEARQESKDEANSRSSNSLPLRVDPWDLDQRLAAISARRPTSPTSSSSSYGSAQSVRSRASSWSNSSGRRIPGTSRDVMEFPFGYPTPD